MNDKELPQEITVKIPAQTYDWEKYTGEHCYLAEALEKEGYTDVNVSGYGNTYIGNINYKPKDEFIGDAVEEAFGKGQDIIVTLIKQ